MKEKATIAQIIRTYWNSARRNRGLIAAMVVALTGATLAELWVPLYYKKFFDVLGASRVGDSGATANLITIIIAIAGVNSLAWILYRFCAFANCYLQPRVMTDLSVSAYEYLQLHSFGFFSNSFVGALVKRVTRLQRSFESFADKIYWNLYPLAIRIIVITAVLYTIRPMIAGILFAWTCLFLLLNYWFSRWKLKYDKERSQKDSESTGVLADAVTNNTNIKLFNGVGYERDRYERVMEELRRLRHFTWNLGETIESIQAALMIGVEVLLLWYAVRYWEKGLLTIGSFVLIQTYLIQLFGRLWDFGRIVRDMYESFADAEEMVAILHIPHEIVDIPTAKPLTIKKGAIEFQRVSFSYHQTRRVLHDISCSIKPGERVALIGPSGSGKSTIVKLLFRFYDIDQGKILIDGQKIHSITQASLHDALSLVPQDPILFHRSLMDNIWYGRRSASDADVIRAAQLAHCDEFIESFPQQYETFVGERGVRLSGGERQRVAIARAILKDAPILVLDEATSSLDSHSETLIQDALEQVMRNRTTIVIAHRLSTIQKMDRIIVLENGTIREQGTHKTLLVIATSLYRKMWKLQAGGFLVDEEGEKE